MRSRLVVFLILLASLVAGLIFARRLVLGRDLPREAFQERTVRVLTYSTFVGANGPGTIILRGFERANGVKFEVVTVNDAGLLLQRLKLAPFDVVIGLDQMLLEEAKTAFEWETLELDRTGWAEAPAALADARFAPIDWSPLTFIHRGEERDVPASFSDLTKATFAGQFTLEDPRASTPGLQFLQWVRALRGDQTAEWLRTFKPNVATIAPSWAFAYGLFKESKTRFVWSYLTSLAFHWGDQKDRGFRGLILPDGHPVQVEFVAIPRGCKECEVARKLVATLFTDESQRALMTRNYMLPVKMSLTQGTIFAELPKVKTITTPTEKSFDEWDQVFK